MALVRFYSTHCIDATRRSGCTGMSDNHLALAPGSCPEVLPEYLLPEREISEPYSPGGSLTTSAAGLSSRSPWYTAWRISPSAVQVR